MIFSAARFRLSNPPSITITKLHWSRIVLMSGSAVSHTSFFYLVYPPNSQACFQIMIQSRHYAKTEKNEYLICIYISFSTTLINSNTTTNRNLTTSFPQPFTHTPRHLLMCSHHESPLYYVCHHRCHIFHIGTRFYHFGFQVSIFFQC